MAMLRQPSPVCASPASARQAPASSSLIGSAIFLLPEDVVDLVLDPGSRFTAREADAEGDDRRCARRRSAILHVFLVQQIDEKHAPLRMCRDAFCAVSADLSHRRAARHLRLLLA